MNLLIFIALFVAYIMLPAWAAETAHIRGLPNRRLFLIMAVCSVVTAVGAGSGFAWAEHNAPTSLQAVTLIALTPACLLAWNIAMVIGSYGNFANLEPRGFAVMLGENKPDKIPPGESPVPTTTVSPNQSETEVSD